MSSGYPSRSLHGSYQSGIGNSSKAGVDEERRVHGRSHSYKHDSRGNVTDRSYPAQGYPGVSSAPPPPLPPKGISNSPNTRIAHAQYSQTARWDLSGEPRGQGSQSDYRYEGHLQDYPETTSEHSLSDSTQTSERSEPTYKRPRYKTSCVILIQVLSVHQHVVSQACRSDY